MTLRQIPELTAPQAVEGMSFDLAARAMEVWNSTAVEASSDNNTISILDPIGENYYGEGVTAKRVAAALRTIGSNPVTVQVNSPGGNFFEGLAIYNLLRAHPYEVTVQVVGIAASAAALVTMAGDQIEIARAGLLMIHNTQWIAVGDRHAMQKAHETMAKFDEVMVSLFVDRTGEPKDDIAAMLDETTFIPGEKAVEMGFADELLEADKVPTTTRASADVLPAYRIENALARAGLPRAERRKLLKDFIHGKPGAAEGNAKPGAGETEAVANDGDSALRIALGRLQLTRA